MATALSDLVTSVRGWTKIQSTSRLTDATIISWVRMAEERINLELITRRMLKVVSFNTIIPVFPAPEDFIQMDYIRFTQGLPLHYCSEDEYWQIAGNSQAGNLPPDYEVNSPRQFTREVYKYTLIGTGIYCLPESTFYNGAPITLGYYAKVPPLADGDTGSNWLWDHHPRLYTFATLAMSAPYLVEDDRSSIWEGEATRLIGMMNDLNKRAKTSGAPLRPHRRSFG